VKELRALWAGQLIGDMYDAHVSARQLADYMGLTPGYVSMVLNGKKTPKGAEQRFRAALQEMRKEKEGE
jgi:predicted transcriptional regulator